MSHCTHWTQFGEECCDCEAKPTAITLPPDAAPGKWAVKLTVAT